MTTAASANLSGNLARGYSVGPKKVQWVTVAVVSGDTGATVTADSLQYIEFAAVCGGPVTLTAQPTYSGNVATLAFTDPVANRFLQVMCIGT